MKSKFLRRVSFLSILFSAVGFLGGCEVAQQQKAGPLEVSVVEVQPEDVTIYQDFVGTVDGVDNAEIRARVPGYVEAQHFRGGEKIKKGDLLFTIDPVLSEAEVRKAQGDLAIARAAAAKARADVERLTPLVQTNAVSRQELDHAKASEDSAKAQMIAADGVLATARANLEFTKVRSPIDGVIGVSPISVGTLVGQGEPTLLATVSHLDTVRVRFPISEQLYLKHAAQIQRLTRGEQGARRLELILADGTTYPELGWIALIDRAISVSTGSILVEARFPNPIGTLRPGQFARVRSATSQVKGALAVPQRAVIERLSNHEIYVLGAGDKVERRAVTVGPRVGRYWLVEKGLVAGDKVLIEGLQKVKPEMVVAPKVVPLGEVSKKPRKEVAPEEAPADEAASGAPAAPKDGAN